MSIEAISWALKRAGLRSSEKFVLVCLANYANEARECYPSIAALEECTSQDRKTIMANLARLVDIKLIRDTGQRRGVTGSIPVYQLNLDSSAENGTVASEAGKQSQFSREAVPKTDGSGPKNGTRNRQEPSGNQQPVPDLPENPNLRTSKGKERGTNTTPPVVLPACVPADLWAEFVADRRERKKAMSSRAQVLALAKLERMHAEGHDVRAVIEQSIERGWQAFYPVKGDAQAGDRSWIERSMA